MTKTHFDKEQLLQELHRLKQENEALKAAGNQVPGSNTHEDHSLCLKLLNAIPDIIIQADLDGTIVFVNDLAFKSFPFLLKEKVLGSSIFSFFPEEELERAKENTRRMFEKPLGAVEYRLQFDGRHEVICEVNGDVLYDLQDKPIGMVFVIRDVSDRKMAEQALHDSENRFRLILDNMPILLNAFDEEGNFIVWNKACEKSTGYAAEEIIGNPKALELLYPDPDYRKLVVEASANKDSNIHTFELITKTGEKRSITWFDTYHSLTIPGWASWGLGQDITERMQTEEQLHLLSLVLEQIQDCVTVTDLKGTITYVNESEQKLLGYTKEELIGKSVHAYGDDPYGGPSQDDIITRTLKDGSWRGEVVNQASDGREVIMDSRTQLVHNKKGEAVALCGISTDITERKKMENALRRERDLFSAGPVFTIKWDVAPGYPVTYVSQNVKDILGYTQEEILHPDFLYTSIIHPDDIVRTEKEIEEHFKNKTDAFEQSYRLKCKDGKFRWFYDFTKVEKNAAGDISSMRGYLFDHTQIKEAEQELILAKERAEESDRLKNAFINNISHEIRTPLNSILGFSQFLVEPDLDQQERYENYELLKNSSDRLVQTVTDIMDVSLITAGSIKANKKSFQLNALLNELLVITKKKCSEKNVVVRLEVPGGHEEQTIHNDQELVSKVFRQLLGNAEKFTQQGRISFGYIPKKGYLEFFVKDTGRGIAPDKLEMIFEAFSQEDPSSTRGYEGSGLGLTIAKGLVNLLGGLMWVESEQGKGSAFYFTLPHEADIGSAEIPEPVKPADFKSNEGAVVLIAEDDHANYLYTNTVLRLAGVSSLHAVNGAEAVEMCREYPEIALVIMDIKMPVINGLEATKLIKADKPDLPVIAVTAHAQTGDEQRMLDAGCDAYAAKPVSKNKMLELLNRFLSIKTNK